MCLPVGFINANRGGVLDFYESAIFEAVSLEPIETDVVVVGAGPVGLFTIFQCGMVSLRCHVVDTFRLRNDLYCVEWGVKLYSSIWWTL